MLLVEVNDDPAEVVRLFKLMVALPPVNVPAVRVKAPATVRVLAPWLKVILALFKLILAAAAVAFIVTVPDPEFASKYTASDDVGAAVLNVDPPEVVAQ